MMKKIPGMCCIIIGAMLLTAALSLVLYNFNQDKKSGDTAQEILTELNKEINEINAERSLRTKDTSDLFQPYEYAEEAEQPHIELDGRFYIGVISIPSLGLELPVQSEWSYPNLEISPCRYKGTADGGDLIIAAHNYRSHFGTIQNLSSGDMIVFTDASAHVYEYEVIQTESVSGRDIESMESGAADRWDLTLFTCTFSGRSRVTVRAVLIEK